MSKEFFAQVDLLTEAGQLRRLSGAFARFIASLGDSAPQLMAACVLLSELEGRGHSCLMLDELNGDPAALLGWSGDEWHALRAAVGDWPADTARWCVLLARCPQVWPVGGEQASQPLVLDGERLYLRRYWLDERHVADSVRARALGGVLAADDDARTSDIRRWLDTLFPHAARGGGVDWQKIACAVAMRGKLGIITGGPGTGKTYTVARLLALLFATAGAEQDGLRVAMAAPTGKAAARLKQSIDSALDELAEKVGDALPLRELAARMGAARTLHSLLGARPDTRAFQHHAGNQLEVDVLIVDEASMIHLEMMSALLAALPDTATLILLGDKDQLASVEAGAVLGDLCHNAEAGEYLPETLSYVEAATGQRIPDSFEGRGGPIAQQTVMLRESRRFGGPIGALALAVNAGDAAGAIDVLREGKDGKVAWTDLAQQADMLQLALQGYREYLQLMKNPPAAGDEVAQLAWVKSVLQRFEAFRILCAVREGEWGVSGLNDAIEQRLQSAGLLKRTGEWYVGRPVMVTRNDYATGVFNGDIGLTLPDPARPGALRVYFSEGEAVRSVLATRLRNVETAFAMTVHKSQGSEFAHTAMVLPKDGGGMLTRELIYTGITRARDYFTLLTPNGQVLLEAIGQRTQRASGLRLQLAG
ncbi:exodeoxyribonuclease V alpha subunit [Duganella sp. 1224]|uniref:exodeoxyribonuclease V subunit alpha n=1 Tax=Duganella sp. 1224 TaxID=2587052 RepID=UPI0015CB94BA|nr:exodeoxyribonuclease V subunit alpha [Duganella sp. 1224]NYE59708.1 exodeoxyribonuclease V alpha subunit [Duganella sp. 1224]